MHGNAIILIALLIVLGKTAVVICNRIQVPAVIGMILFGVLLGPTCLGIVNPGAPGDYHVIKLFADIGVIILLFMAGLETNITRLVQSSKTGMYIALGGMLVPFALGFGVSMGFSAGVDVALIMGVILMATSVSITVFTLMEMRKLQTPEGSSIITAAIIDDILGIIFLTLILGLTGSGERPLGVSVLIIVTYLGASILLGIFVIPPLVRIMAGFQVRHGVLALSISLLFVFAWVAERAGIAAITGAYLIGVFIGRTRYRDMVNEGIETIGQGLFISIFFISIGLQLDLKGGDFDVLFIILFLLAAMFGKILGSGIGAKIGGFSWLRSLRIGLGMMPRGEVALVIASIAMDPRHGSILNQSHFTTVVLIVLFTCVLTPVLFKAAFRER